MEIHKVQLKEKEIVVLLDEEMRLVNVVNEYLEYCKLRGLALNTIKAYGYDLKAFFEFLAVQHVEYTEVTPLLIRKYVEHLRNVKETASIYVESARTASTINRMLGTINGFYHYQSSINSVANPFDISGLGTGIRNEYKSMFYHIRRTARPSKSLFKVKTSSYKINILSDEELQSIYDNLTTSRDRLIFKFLIQSGARISEVLSLKIDDIPIPDSGSVVTILKNIKSKGKNRSIYIPTKLAVELDEYVMNERINRETEHDYLFTAHHRHYSNRPYSYSSAYEVFKRAGRKAGIDLKFHDLRHTFITRLIESGIDISIVKEIAGHEHISTTQRYITLSSDYIATTLEEYWKTKE